MSFHPPSHIAPDEYAYLMTPPSVMKKAVITAVMGTTAIEAAAEAIAATSRGGGQDAASISPGIVRRERIPTNNPKSCQVMIKHVLRRVQWATVCKIFRRSFAKAVMTNEQKGEGNILPVIFDVVSHKYRKAQGTFQISGQVDIRLRTGLYRLSRDNDKRDSHHRFSISPPAQNLTKVC